MKHRRGTSTRNTKNVAWFLAPAKFEGSPGEPKLGDGSPQRNEIQRVQFSYDNIPEPCHEVSTVYLQRNVSQSSLRISAGSKEMKNTSAFNQNALSLARNRGYATSEHKVFTKQKIACKTNERCPSLAPDWAHADLNQA